MMSAYNILSLNFVCNVYKGSAKVNKLLHEKWKAGKLLLKQLLQETHKVTICVDGWTKKGLSSSFFGISACFYSTTTGNVVHAILELLQLSHPHTGQMLAKALHKCFKRWHLNPSRILMIVSDNRSNMIKAVKTLNENLFNLDLDDLSSTELLEDEEDAEIENVETATETERDEVEDSEVSDTEDAQTEAMMETTMIQLQTDVTAFSYLRVACIAHTLQLVIKKCYAQHYDTVIAKARDFVGQIRRSSVTTQFLFHSTGKNVISDNSTRWNSTFYMCKRLLQLRAIVTEVLAKQVQIDNLKVSEWLKLEELISLLEPFTDVTNVLQSDARSLSYIFPSLLELECHLLSFKPSAAAARIVVTATLIDFRTCFASILQPNTDDADEIHVFNAIPVAACLLDPHIACLMMLNENLVLLTVAKEYIISKVRGYCTSYTGIIALHNI